MNTLVDMFVISFLIKKLCFSTKNSIGEVPTSPISLASTQNERRGKKDILLVLHECQDEKPLESKGCPNFNKKESIEKARNIEYSIKTVSPNNLFTAFNESRLVSDHRIFNLDPSNVILDHEIQSAKKLLIEDVEGKLLFDKKLIIDAAGLEGSARNCRDGVTYFGFQKPNDKRIVNDFILNSEDETDSKRIFSILFLRNEQQYVIRYINDKKKGKDLLYFKIEKPFKIQEKRFFFIGECIFYIEPFESKFIIEVFNSSYPKGELFQFSPVDSPVTIGRGKCKIKMNSSIYSKIHCTIEFNQTEGKWYIKDGCNKKKSTNGTWILLEKKFVLEATSYFKLGANIFKVTIIDENY